MKLIFISMQQGDSGSSEGEIIFRVSPQTGDGVYKHNTVKGANAEWYIRVSIPLIGITNGETNIQDIQVTPNAIIKGAVELASMVMGVSFELID